MKRICPTIQELLAFDAIARYESMTIAASVLCLSVSGISKQLTGLERFIGKPLLIKKGRGIQLNAMGKAYWAKISPALRALESATIDASSRDTPSGVLRLASAPTFLTKWLIPRLSEFRRQHADITFSFIQYPDATERHSPEADAVIRYGNGHWPDVTSEYIIGCEFVCIYSAELFSINNALLTPEDILQQTLLHHEEAPQAWPSWAKYVHLDKAHIFSGPRFVQYSALIQAALNGFGVGFVPKVLVQEELHAKRLIAFGDSIDVDQGHYLCFQADRLDNPVFAAFRTWLHAACQQK